MSVNIKENGQLVKTAGLNSQTVIIDNLTTQDATKALSANQGYVLNQNKVDKVTGKGLSTNDYTNEDKAKVTSSDSKITNYEDRGYLGKNVLPYPYLFSNTTRTGMTITVQTDGKIAVTGTNTSSVVERIDIQYFTLDVGSYVISGLFPKTGCYATLRDGDTGSWIANIETNSYTLNVASKKKYLIAINITSGNTTGVTYEPMIRIASDTDSTFKPYVKSNVELDAEISTKIDKTASEIQTSDGQFTTVTGGLMQSCLVDLDPIQDLHGYSKPWTGGSGKNKIPLTIDGIKSANTYGTWNGNVYTFYGITWTINTDSDGNVIGIRANGSVISGQSFSAISFPTPFSATSYVLNGCPSNGSSSTYFLQAIKTNVVDAKDTGSGVNISVSSSDTITIRAVVMSGYTANNLVFKPMLRLSSVSDATFEPYSNICAISGHTQVQVENVGKNWLSPTLATTTLNGITCTNNGDGTYTLNGTATADTDFTIQSLILPEPIRGKELKLVGCPVGGSSTSYRLQLRGTNFLDVGNGYVSSYNLGNANNLQIRISSGTTLSNKVFKPMLTLDTSATYDGYEPYKGYTTTINLGGTYYGGTLDAVSGKFISTHAIVDMGSLSWFLAATNRFDSSSISNNIKKPTSTSMIANIICENYATLSIDNLTDKSIGVYTNGNLIVKDSTYSDATTFKTAMSGVMLCYELATPQTIQLDPQTLETLVGQNDVFAPLVGQTLEEVEFREVLSIDDVVDAIPYENVAPDMGTGENRTYFRIKKYGRLVQLEFIQSNYWMVVEQQTKVVFGVLPDGYYDKQPSSMLYPDVEFEYPFVNETATNQYDNRKLFINMVNGEVYSVYQANDVIHPMGNITYILHNN